MAAEGCAERRVITYDDAVRAGIGLFIRTSTVEMEALARRLCVSRATLYRVVPGRDRLLGDVLWRQAEHMHLQARTAAGGEGVDRILGVLRHVGCAILQAQPFRRFIADEPGTAIRVLFSSSGAVHERFVALNRELIAEEAEAGRYTPPLELDHLAYVFVRIFESMWYADLLSNRRPDLDVAEQAGRAVLLAG